MIKRILFSVAFLLLAGLAPVNAAPLTVTVSVAPLKYFTQSIGGDRVEVEVMVAPGASPATYEPKPRQMMSLTRSRLYIAIGVPFERAWLPRMRSANPEMTVVKATSGMQLMAMASHHHEDGEEEAHENEHDEQILDPHVWNSPKLARELAAAILSALVQADAAGSSAYRENYDRLVARIDAVDAEIGELLRDARGAHFLVYHPSWGYFARDYGVIQIPVELEGKEPGPKEVAQVIRMAKEESIKAIFVQPQFSDKSARIIADAIGGQVIVADPLAEDWADNMLKVARQFSAALR